MKLVHGMLVYRSDNGAARVILKTKSGWAAHELRLKVMLSGYARIRLGIKTGRYQLRPKIQPNTTLPADAKARKNIPLYSGLIKYFPDALAAVAELSRIGNEQHSPGQPLNWDRSKSSDEHDALCRHLWEAGTVDTDGVRHSVKVAWRALAALQKEIEANRSSAQPCSDDK